MRQSYIFFYSFKAIGGIYKVAYRVKFLNGYWCEENDYKTCLDFFKLRISCIRIRATWCVTWFSLFNNLMFQNLPGLIIFLHKKLKHNEYWCEENDYKTRVDFYPAGNCHSVQPENWQTEFHSFFPPFSPERSGVHASIRCVYMYNILTYSHTYVAGLIVLFLKGLCHEINHHKGLQVTGLLIFWPLKR